MEECQREKGGRRWLVPRLLRRTDPDQGRAAGRVRGGWPSGTRGRLSGMSQRSTVRPRGVLGPESSVPGLNRCCPAFPITGPISVLIRGLPPLAALRRVPMGTLAEGGSLPTCPLPPALPKPDFPHHFPPNKISSYKTDPSVCSFLRKS